MVDIVAGMLAGGISALALLIVWLVSWLFVLISADRRDAIRGVWRDFPDDRRMVVVFGPILFVIAALSTRSGADSPEVRHD